RPEERTIWTKTWTSWARQSLAALRKTGSAMQQGGDADEELEGDEHDDDDFEKLVAAAAGLIVEEAVDVADRCELGVDLPLPIGQSEALGDGTVNARVVRIADDFQRVARAVDEFEHVDDEIAQRLRLVGFAPPAQRPHRFLRTDFIDAVELAVEQRVVGPELE